MVELEFQPPDWSAPLDVDERVRLVPPTAMVKGMFLERPIAEAQRRCGRRPVPGEYVPFRDYPITEHIRVLAACAAAAWPDVPLREGIRRLGRDAFRTFLESLAGRVVFAAAGRNFDAGLGLTTRAYGLTGPVGTARVVERTPGAAVVELRGIHSLADCYHVGVFEAGMEHFHEPGEVLIRVHSACDVDFKLVLRG